MKTFLYTITVLIVIIWALSYFVFSLSSLLIHLLLILAVVIGLIGHKKYE